MELVIGKRLLPVIVIDFLAYLAIYFLPAVSHLTTIPFQLIEPMRLMVLLSLLVMGNKHNAYILALTLPLFSFLVSGHPLFAKMILITVELCLNVALYEVVSKVIRSPFVSILISIILSKVIYYGLKFVFVISGLLVSSVVSTSLWIQVFVSLVTAFIFGLLQTSKLKRA